MHNPSITPNAATHVAILVSASPKLYVAMVLIAALVAGYYRLRADTIFACQAQGYSSERYLSYCETRGYGDFDHGAFWFDLEPAATRSAATAEVLFIGNSRMEYGLSSSAAQSWLNHNTRSYFLLGFAYYPRVLFQRALLRKLKPRARLYVINLDSFFAETLSEPAQAVMEDPDARAHYRNKQRWQTLHRAVCGRIDILCANSLALFKDRRTGTWHPFGRIWSGKATSEEANSDPTVVARHTIVGRQFLDELGVEPRCVIFTLVPSVNTPRRTSEAIAANLHAQFIAPEVEGLNTFDGSHLDSPSAERWSDAFLKAAGPRMLDCLRGSDRDNGTGTK